jgi:hypothetical protein
MTITTMTYAYMAPGVHVDVTSRHETIDVTIEEASTHVTVRTPEGRLLLRLPHGTALALADAIMQAVVQSPRDRQETDADPVHPRPLLSGL